MTEQPVIFECAGDRLVGVASVPDEPPQLGVLILVGGPQYRVGSHRQFLLLARRLAAAGPAAMRFDFRGMGDSEGGTIAYDETAPDIACAIDALTSLCPSIERVVLYGLCDAASAALMYSDSGTDARVAGLVLLNPWVDSEQGRATAYVKHYYAGRILQASFWRKLLAGRVDVTGAVGHLLLSIRRMLGYAGEVPTRRSEPLPERMGRALDRLATPALLLLSGHDLTAREFDAFNCARLRGRPPAAFIEQHMLDDADHTFASSSARKRVEDLTAEWLHRTYAARADGPLLNMR